MSDTKKWFFDAADAWLCDGYALDIRYVADIGSEGPQLRGATFGLRPLQASRDHSFAIQTDNILAGQIQRYPVSKSEAIEILAAAAKGEISVPSALLRLPKGSSPDCYSEMHQRDRWFSELHLQVGGGRIPPPSAEKLMNIENDLRAAQTPFDGLSDLLAWLGLEHSALSGAVPTVVLRVGPPVDLIVDRCALSRDELSLVIHAHASFDTARVGISVRGVPGVGLSGRRQISAEIQWGEVREGKREGIAAVTLTDVDQVLGMLLVGGSTVRRHWFVDPAKARNNRLLAMQHFDADLRMIRRAVLESQDSKTFETGVAAVLYLHGFAPAVQLEVDAPDLVVSTPVGRLAVVECTTRISDVASKLGKLVDLRGAVTKAIAGSGHGAHVLAVLVCRLPRDQIAAHVDDFLAQKVLLVSGDDLARALVGVRNAVDPDELFEKGLASIGEGGGALQ